jgi:hypothetical protein
MVSEAIWKVFHEAYRGEEIKRYAVYRNNAGFIDRSPNLVMVSSHYN